MATILNVCALARTTLKRPQDAVDLWRFLNLLHVAAYCGLTPTYNRQNLLDQFVRDFGLASSHGVAKRTDEVDVDHSGPQMYNAQFRAILGAFCAQFSAQFSESPPSPPQAAARDGLPMSMFEKQEAAKQAQRCAAAAATHRPSPPAAAALCEAARV